MSSVIIVLCVIAMEIYVLLVVAAAKPDMFTVQRSASFDAPAERIFPWINDLRAHESWSPFDKPDWKSKSIHGGADRGPGAIYAWEGKGRAGSGWIAITQSQPHSRIEMQLDMLRPIRSRNTVVFTLEPRGETTLVTWAVHGAVPFLAKILHVFVNMDKMVGGEFRKGLVNLKTIVERQVGG